MTRIETKRLFLRPLAESDVTQVYADWLNDPEVNRYLETRHAVQTLESCKDFVKKCNRDDSSHLFGVFLKEGSIHIGNAKLGFINRFHGTGQLSLFIGEKTCWGKGLAGEIVQGLTEYGFTRLGLERIEAGIYEDNLASLRAFLKVGYNVDGFLRSHVVSNNRRTGSFWLGILKHELRTDCFDVATGKLPLDEV